MNALLDLLRLHLRQLRGLSSPIGDDIDLAKVLTALGETARWLDKNVGRAEDLLAEVAGWCGIVAAGLLLPDGKPRRLFGEAGLVRALGELVGDDGGVLSRSPLGQMEAIALLVDLAACYRAVRRDPPRALDTMLGLLVPPLLALTHSDGSLGNWQGAGAVSAERIAALIGASKVSQIEDCVGALKNPKFSPDELARIDQYA